MSTVKEVSKGGNVAYYISQDKGVVVAKICSDESEAYDIVESIANRLASSDVSNSPFDICRSWPRYGRKSALALRPYYIGCAKCSPDDTFDLDAGKRIALARAQKKYHADLNQRLVRMSMFFCEISQRIERRALEEFEKARRYQEEYSRVQGSEHQEP